MILSDQFSIEFRQDTSKCSILSILTTGVQPGTILNGSRNNFSFIIKKCHIRTVDKKKLAVLTFKIAYNQITTADIPMKQVFPLKI